MEKTQQNEQQISSQRKFGKYRLGKTLGQGYQAKVKIGYNEKGETFALKIFKQKHSLEKNMKDIEKEAGNLQNLRHQNLVNLVEIITNEIYTKKNGTTFYTVGIAMELCQKGELFEYLLHSGRFSQDQCRYYFLQLLEGLKYLFENQLCHRDLKPENLLLDNDYNLKIADFGFSSKLEGKQGDGFLKSSLGTVSYMAPELHERKKYVGTQVDIFSAGVILFVMYTGHPPFNQANENDSYYKLMISDRNKTFWDAHQRNKEADFFEKEFIDLINSIFAYSQFNRIDLAEIYQHPWLKGKVSKKEEIKNLFSQKYKKVQDKIQEQKQKKLIEKQLKQNQEILGQIDQDQCNIFLFFIQISKQINKQRKLRQINYWK